MVRVWGKVWGKSFHQGWSGWSFFGSWFWHLWCQHHGFHRGRVAGLVGGAGGLVGQGVGLGLGGLALLRIGCPCSGLWSVPQGRVFGFAVVLLHRLLDVCCVESGGFWMLWRIGRVWGGVGLGVDFSCVRLDLFLCFLYGWISCFSLLFICLFLCFFRGIFSNLEEVG